jgi:hypothetical protein
MSLQALSLIAQILGVLLVSGSLLFVGLQMRQTHAIERANAQRDLLNQTQSWWLLGVQDEAMLDTISAGLQDFKNLSRFRQARFHVWGMNLHHIVEGVFFQNKSGLIMPTSHEGYTIAFLAVIKTPGGLQWWDEASKVGNVEFCTYIAKRLTEDGASLPSWTDLLPHYLLPNDPPISCS